MKKIICLLIAIAMLASFAACGETSTSVYSQGLTKNGYYDVKYADIVTLPDYKNLEIPEDEIAVTEDEILSSLQSFASSNPETTEIRNRAIENGDQVNIDYTGYIDDEAFEGGTAVGALVTAGSQQFIDDFLTQIIGHMPGESFDVFVTFPEEYPSNPDLAGKDARFFVVINFIQESKTPEITDEFIKESCEEQYGVTTVDGMKEYIRNELLKSKKLNYISDFLYSGATFGEIPETVIAHQKECVRGNYEDMAANYGIELADLLAYSGFNSIDELLEAYADQITEMAKDALIYQAVANENKLKISNKDVADYFEESSGSRDYSVYEEHYGLPYLKMLILQDKAQETLLECVK